MPAKDKQQGGSVASGGMIVAIIVAASAFLIQKEAPLEGARPNAQETAFHGYAYHDISARLWQDPFGAVEKNLTREATGNACDTPDKRARTDVPKGAKGKAAAPSTLPVQTPEFEHIEHIKLERRSRADEQTLVLPVMVSGAPYAEDVEFRRRLRYAVVSALARKRFQPADAQHIDYYRACVTGSDDRPIKTIVPYEWFDREPSKEGSNDPRSILILWINEQFLTDTIAKEKTPVKILEDMTSPFFGYAMSGAQVCPSARLPVPIIGPHTSDALLAIVNERRHSGFKFTSYGATIALNEDVERQHDGGRQCSLQLGSATIERTITPDDILAANLVAELDRRNVSFAKGHSIALVSEWDTTYGQAIKENVRCAYRKDESSPSVEPSSNNPRIIQKSYLRGIDGVMAPDEKKTENQRSGKDADKAADDKEAVLDRKAARAGDRPHGPGQSDYLRRLADSLIDEDKQIRFEGGAGIKAIGVLGSDVFDKLLVLRALKPNFPNAIFFTTDYDAALAMHGELDWTRNLIVASSFGPMLADEFQGDIPPFRSAYQTSAFLATQLAIDDRQDMARAKKIRKELQRPQLFEITRTGVYLPLRQPVKKGDAPPSPTEVQREPPQTFPDLPTQEKFFVASILAVGGVAFLAMAYAQSRKANGIRRSGAWKDTLIIGLSLLCAAFVVGYWKQAALWLTETGGGEPIAWSEGVSVWPTIAIRLLVIILCWLIVVRTSRRLDENLYEIAKKLRLACPVLVIERASRPKKIAFDFECDFRPWLDILTPNKSTFDCDAKRNKFYTIRSGWAGYVCAGRKNARHLRTAFVSSLLFLMFCIVWHVYGNIVPPIRGDFGRNLFEVTLPIEFLFIAYAIMYVTDATILCLCFVNDLEYHPTIWPTHREAECAKSAAAEPGQSIVDGLRNDELDLKFIEMRTACILPLAYWPFLLVALTIVERSRIFANYPDSGAILFFTTLALAIIIGCAFALNRAVEFARASSKRKIEDALFGDTCAKSRNFGLQQKSSDSQRNSPKEHGDSKPLSDADRGYLEALLEKITNLDGGAFSPIWRQPLLKGLVLPIAGFASNILFTGNWLSRL